MDFGSGYSPFANGIASHVAAGIGAGFDGFRQLAQIDALEAGAAGMATGREQLVGLLDAYVPEPYKQLVPPVPDLGAVLPDYPVFPFHPWLSRQVGGYEGLAGARFQGRVRVSYVQESQSWSLFTHNELELQNDFELTVGLRYTVEDKSLTSNLVSNDQVCLTVSQHLGGFLQSNQGYFAGVGAHAQSLQQYLGEMDTFVSTLQQAAPALPPQVGAVLGPSTAQLSQGVADARAQLGPGLSQVANGGQAVLTSLQFAEGIAALAALGCNPFVDPTRDGQ